MGILFDEYSGIEKEGQTKRQVTGDIRLLQELADKLMELARAGGEIDEDEHPGYSENEGAELNYSFAPEQQGYM
jgi:hypothetical protein